MSGSFFDQLASIVVEPVEPDDPTALLECPEDFFSGWHVGESMKSAGQLEKAFSLFDEFNGLMSNAHAAAAAVTIYTEEGDASGVLLLLVILDAITTDGLDEARDTWRINSVR